MKINASRKQLKRLKVLLEKVFPVVLKQGGKCDLERYSYPCGAPMCIAGHAAVLPEFNIQGLVISKDDTYNYGRPEFAALSGSRALDAFFGKDASHYLFRSNSTINLSDHQVVIDRECSLRRFLNENQ